MIDNALLRSDPDLIRRTAEQRGVDVDVDRLIEVEAQLRQAMSRSTTLQGQQRRLAMRGPQADPAAAQAGQEELRAVTDQVRALQPLRDELWERVPNLLPADTPAGADAGGNVELRRVGDPAPPGEARRHGEVGKSLGILAPDSSDSSDSSGQSGVRWLGDGARLAWAVFSHAQSVLQARGFTPMLAQPGSREEPIGYYGDQIVDAARLPIRVSMFSSYPVHTVRHGVLCRPEDSERWLDECQRNVEEILRGLELPYRVVRVCAGALQTPEYKAYHTETWFPGAGSYQQTHSAANQTDYLARRLKIRYLDRGRVAQPHTLSATGGTDRAVLAILENHVQPDGSVRIPAALRAALGGQELIGPPSA
ncbi:MAG: aminoacyl--tRNA ligase-related protein [Pseudonocardiaceae bacterium]